MDQEAVFSISESGLCLKKLHLIGLLYIFFLFVAYFIVILTGVTVTGITILGLGDFIGLAEDLFFFAAFLPIGRPIRRGRQVAKL